MNAENRKKKIAPKTMGAIMVSNIGQSPVTESEQQLPVHPEVLSGVGS
jgi:hypothetical protein